MYMYIALIFLQFGKFPQINLHQQIDHISHQLYIPQTILRKILYVYFKGVRVENFVFMSKVVRCHHCLSCVFCIYILLSYLPLRIGSDCDVVCL